MPRPPTPKDVGAADWLATEGNLPRVPEIGAAEGDSDAEQSTLSQQQIECLARALEVAPRVNRRSQFFVWCQMQLFPLLPHDLLVCGAYQRQRRALLFDVFQGVVIPRDTLEPLCDGQSSLMRAVTGLWIDRCGDALLLSHRDFSGEASQQALRLLNDAGVQQYLVHGVARPLRPGEVESLFVFASSREDTGAAGLRRRQQAQLLIPFLHSTWSRVQSTEFALSRSSQPSPGPTLPPPQAAPVHAATEAVRSLTLRERQILQWAREGKSNPQIGEALGISPLTVKNHIQNILRKLGANNRAHAVALAMSLDLLTRPGPRG